MILLPPDFKDFLKLLNSNKAQYLLIGGYAVGYYGFPHATGDMDIWINPDPDNAERVSRALEEFGFNLSRNEQDLLTQEKHVIRMGVPPIRIELLTSISGVNFSECFPRRVEAVIDDIHVNIISLDDLKINKKASGRHNDLNDLEHLD